MNRRGRAGLGGPRGRRRAAQASPRGPPGSRRRAGAGRLRGRKTLVEVRSGGLCGDRAVSRRQGQTSGRGQTSRPDQVPGRGPAPPGGTGSRGGGSQSHPGRVQATPPGSRFGYPAPGPQPDERGMQCSRVGADQRGGNAEAGWSAGNFRTGTPSLIIQALALPGCRWPALLAQTRPLTCGLERGCLEGGVLSGRAAASRCRPPAAGAGALQSPNPGARCWGVSCLEGGDETRLADRKTSCTSLQPTPEGN